MWPSAFGADGADLPWGVNPNPNLGPNP
jgi:hypothetical protein